VTIKKTMNITRARDVTSFRLARGSAPEVSLLDAFCDSDFNLTSRLKYEFALKNSMDRHLTLHPGEYT